MSTTHAPVSTRPFEGVTIPTPGTFTLDASHSSVGFVARHLMVSKVRGHFAEFSGSITIAEDPLQSSVEVEIAVASITSGDAQRDGHLTSGDFFDAEAFPTITFKSTKVTHASDEDFVVEGDLTVRDVTKTVSLKVEFAGVQADPWGGERIGFSAETELDREDFGLTWNVALETGGVLVGKKAKIEIEAEAVRQA